MTNNKYFKIYRIKHKEKMAEIERFSFKQDKELGRWKLMKTRRQKYDYITKNTTEKERWKEKGRQ